MDLTSKLIHASGMTPNASFVVPQVSAQANGPPVITPTKANAGDDTMDVESGSVVKANNEEEIIFIPDDLDDPMDEIVADPDPVEEITEAVEPVVKIVHLTKPDTVEVGKIGTVTGEKQGVIFST